MDVSFESLLGVALGIGLAAATGFRIFLPLLIAGLSARFGYLPLGEDFQWLASSIALFTLGTAAVFETLAYYIPGVDHLLDVIASPARSFEVICSILFWLNPATQYRQLGYLSLDSPGWQEDNKRLPG